MPLSYADELYSLRSHIHMVRRRLQASARPLLESGHGHTHLALPARIEKTQEALARHGLAALLVPSSDPHLSEYLPERWQGRQWLSGFTGSMGTLVVTRDEAALFADSRYWVQAEAELAGSGIELVKIPTGTATHHVDWLAARGEGRRDGRASTAACSAWPRRSSCAPRWSAPA